MRAPRLLRTAAFKLAALYGLLFGTSVLILMAVIFTVVEQTITSQMAATVRIEAEALAEAVAAGRAPAELAPNPSVRRFLRLGDGTVILDDIVPRASIAGPFTLDASNLRSDAPGQDDEDGDASYVAYGLRLPGGGYVLAAQDNERVTETREAISGAFTIALLLALTLSVVGGALLSWLYLRRIEGFNRVARAIFDGHLDKRMPVGGSDDELDRLASNLNRMLDRIARLMEAMRQVSADIAHDLRTPLGRLRQKLERLAVPGGIPNGQELAGRALKEVDAILDTFGGLLRIAQIESGGVGSGFGDIDLSALTRQIVEIYGPVAQEGRRMLDASIEAGVRIRGDRSLIQQLFVNIIENALTHTPEGTRVTVSLSGSRRRWTAVIADDGPGIPIGEREKIFGRFYRLEKSRSTPGTGLGLALARAIADVHGIALMAGDNAPGLRITMLFGAPCDVGARSELMR